MIIRRVSSKDNDNDKDKDKEGDHDDKKNEMGVSDSCNEERITGRGNNSDTMED